ncbi:unnamed protein product [Heligmosomoides polygyrus]|uniref:Uncharacterized protein n=1 Tax=Heligmosomoides polygyrus TaxID=6339 RepID=A0A3P8AIB8_HELPZ|nr:unnamed protein product [Heligmosomoides polygyrus]
MEGLVGLGGKSEPGTWYRVHATVGASSECATRAWAQEHFGNTVWTFQQDDTAAHKSKKTQERAFSELSSYYSGIEDASGGSGSSGCEQDEDDDSDDEESDGDDEEEDDDEEEYEDDDEYESNDDSDDDEEEESSGSEEASESSRCSVHPSDTSFELSTLIEETDPDMLDDFVRLRPVDREWVEAAWSYTDNEPVFHYRTKYYLRHPIPADGKTALESRRRVWHDPLCMSLPDLDV